jgi:predicted DCC family thiol-disulfide oxidoreductase YuxK
VLPAWLRDPFYKLVAKSRYALFGEYKPTPLPDPTWAKRFL